MRTREQRDALILAFKARGVIDPLIEAIDGKKNPRAGAVRSGQLLISDARTWNFYSAMSHELTKIVHQVMERQAVPTEDDFVIALDRRRPWNKREPSLFKIMEFFSALESRCLHTYRYTS